jgi:hypothetical protein
MNPALFLKRILLLDAASCLAMGLLLIVGASWLTDLFAISRTLLLAAGIILVPSGLFMGWLASRMPPIAALVALVVIGNILWVAESFLILGQNPAATAIGKAFVIVQAVAVAGLALLEAIGLLRLRSLRA